MALAHPSELTPSENATSSVPASDSRKTVKPPHLSAQSLIEEESSRILHRVSPTDIAQAQRDGIITFVQALVQRCFAQWGEVGNLFGSDTFTAPPSPAGRASSFIPISCDACR